MTNYRCLPFHKIAGSNFVCQDIPSSQIDAAICDLLAKIQNFSDSYIDISCIQLTEKEVEQLVIKLIVYLTNELKGSLLAEIVSEMRDDENPFKFLV